MIKTLTNRALNVCSSEKAQEEEFMKLRQIFKSNGYSVHTINKAMKYVIKKRDPTAPDRTQRDGIPTENTTNKLFMCLPYDENLFKHLRPIQRRYNIKIAWKPANKLSQKLVHLKDRSPKERSTNVIYKIKCSDGNCYIGETSRTLEQRVKEHKEAYKKMQGKSSAIAEYSINNGVVPLWNEVEILAKEKDWRKRRIKEALHIERYGSLNRNHGLDEVTNWWS